MSMSAFDPSPVVKKHRQPSFPIHPLIYSRWSPRALSGEKISHEQLMTLFEAARWAPSASNRQPWTFLYAHRETKHWATFYSVLDDINQIWTKNAAVLVVVVTQIEFEGKKKYTSQFDTGAAWQNLALEATHQGLIAHAMIGLDIKLATQKFNIPDTHRLMAMIAIGKPGSLSNIPERMHKKEFPKGRKELSEIVKEGVFE